jgi:hypothetical protein
MQLLVSGIYSCKCLHKSKFFGLNLSPDMVWYSYVCDPHHDIDPSKFMKNEVGYANSEHWSFCDVSGDSI